MSVFTNIKKFIVKNIDLSSEKSDSFYLNKKYKNISKQIESNSFFKKRNSEEIEFISNIVEYGEELKKEFECHSNLEGGIKIKGELLITNKRIIFLCKRGEEMQFVSFDYFELEEFYESTLRDKSVGTLHAVVGGEIYTFSGLMRFGLSGCVEYVNNKMFCF